MAKEKIRARARTQYTDYMVKEPMELMEFLAAKMPDASRTKLKSLLSKRIVYVDSVITTQYNFPLKPGMKVQISREKGRKEFSNRLLKIVYEDAYIIVVEKMQGLLSVNTERQKERTAYTILNEYVQRSGRQHRVYIVHRLDRDTSGLMMFAKDEKTQNTLRDNWHNIVTDRRYVAVVAGEMENNAGMVRSWLTDRKLYVYSSPTDDGGKEAVTHYRTIKRANGFSLVELVLETGRKNQIRVHMQDLGHPIIGDGRYGLEEVNPINRLALHAFKLCFHHPVTGELMQFETPYPGEFKKLFLKQKYHHSPPNSLRNNHNTNRKERRGRPMNPQYMLYHYGRSPILLYRTAHPNIVHLQNTSRTYRSLPLLSDNCRFCSR